MNVRIICILIALAVSISSPVTIHLPCAKSKLHAKLDCTGKKHAVAINSDTQYLFEDQFSLPLLENRDAYRTANPVFNPFLFDYQKEHPPRILS